MSTQNKLQKKMRLKKKIRARIIGSAERPRLTVTRSNSHIYAQLINDTTATTIAAANDMNLKAGSGVERATMVGKAIATLAKKAGITAIVFDRNGYKYAGRVQALADAARLEGLEF
jgi:large subunit ribosomal protein L18